MPYPLGHGAMYTKANVRAYICAASCDHLAAKWQESVHIPGEITRDRASICVFAWFNVITCMRWGALTRKPGCDEMCSNATRSIDSPLETHRLHALRKDILGECWLGVSRNAHAGSRTRVTSMGGLYDAATLHAPVTRLALQVLAKDGGAIHNRTAANNSAGHEVA